ncbi:MAG TPA: VanW family protein, partial [Thermomicrobiales bacterium]|nr:VanW family protein [Thermomicrobiales bacterium]
DHVVAAFGQAKPAVTLRSTALPPKWTAADLSKITLGDDILGEAGTYYGDSSDARRNNVNRASTLETGWLIPPGGVYSYADHVRPVDESNGFVTGFGIVQDGGGFTTAPVVGGGICQVSTTIFQAAFWAGLPIVERVQHPYYLRVYGEAVNGLPGLDAMVNIEPDWTLDFKFQNTTGHWLAVIVIADGQNVWARMVGTNPGWKIDVTDPVITNRVSPGTDMRYEDSPELPAGQSMVVETAQDGFDVAFDRTVYDKTGKVIDTYHLSSSFAPAYNVTLRGTG